MEGGGWSEPRSHHHTPAWATERDFVSTTRTTTTITNASQNKPFDTEEIILAVTGLGKREGHSQAVPTPC